MAVSHLEITNKIRVLEEVLMSAAMTSPCGKLLIYPQGSLSEPTEILYSHLHTDAKEKSRILRSLHDGFNEGEPVLLRLNNHWDLILWFWSVVLAGGVPVPIPPLGNAPEQRIKYTQGLVQLFGSPIVITTEMDASSFDSRHSLRLRTIESMSPSKSTREKLGVELHPDFMRGPASDDLAVLMMTSGSTGKAKAVRLTHAQILSSVDGKATVRQLPRHGSFLNWLGLDHVASLVEIHIQALRLHADQVHVHTSDILSTPSFFLELLSRHRVSRSFALNFFLAKLVSGLDDSWGVQGQEDSAPWDFTTLALLASGGEANDIETCIETSRLLSRYGAPCNVVVPGFGMTETCAGAIFNLDCPDYDLHGNNKFVSLGKCMDGIEMRVKVCTIDGNMLMARVDQPGDLEVRGAVVFESYYNNPEASTEAFTSDGWFKTGDRATIDLNGNLHLIGRTKEVMNINGVKVSSSDVQAALDHAVVNHVGRVVAFPSRSERSPTEQVVVAYTPRYWPLPAGEIADIDARLVQACVMCTGSRPLIFLVPDESLFPRTTLGKIYRATMRALFESGGFDKNIREHDTAMQQQTKTRIDMTTTESEAQLIEDFVEILNIDRRTIGVETPIFTIGFTSLDLVRLKRRIDTRLQISLPIIKIMKNPTARSLARAIWGETSEHLAGVHGDLDGTAAASYDPVVTFSAKGSKTPLWLIHPGIGEILVFTSLAQYMASDDRPVHALRARGFDPGQPRFRSITETVDAYLAAIRKRQPHGPYAIAGYSYGAILAFEVTKKLEADGGPGVVQFLGSFNLPPHIKSRMRQLNWNLCLLHLSMFLGLITEPYANRIEERIPYMQQEDALALILTAADKSRMLELALDGDALATWAELAFGLQSMAVDYEPEGSVASIDVFHAMPLTIVAKSREDWMLNHMSKWGAFSRTKPRFHEVGGTHYTMIGEHVEGFSATLKSALKRRGL